MCRVTSENKIMNLSNYAAERAAAQSNYTVEEETEYLAALPDVIYLDPEFCGTKRYDDQLGYGAMSDSNDDPFELSLESCHRAFSNDFNDE